MHQLELKVDMMMCSPPSMVELRVEPYSFYYIELLH
jgi:hypothetical protein